MYLEYFGKAIIAVYDDRFLNVQNSHTNKEVEISAG
jgi:hypothetical protein